MTLASFRFVTSTAALTLGSMVLACQMPNPEFDGLADESGTTRGDGDGDPTTTGDGDGDSTTTTGDGDGDPNTTTTGTGDGDGDPTTEECTDNNLTLCDAACVDTSWDTNHCGDCSQPCAGGQLCGFAECLPKRYMFVTTHLFPGNFGGLGIADEKCNALAAEAQLPGVYIAWLSDGNISPEFRMPLDAAAYVTRNGPPVAWSWEDLIDGQLSAKINRDQYGDLITASPVEACQIDYGVWTATTNAGAGTEPLCGGWDTAGDGAFGVIGDAGSQSQWSEIDCQAPCSSMLPVYCVQVEG